MSKAQLERRGEKEKRRRRSEIERSRQEERLKERKAEVEKDANGCFVEQRREGRQREYEGVNTAME
jgi:hypothetical protein